mmetsp:Transcript_18225/g.23573  ORF Transcript_18225/g.23573 Transcript_18225/m.23573 type:complete len:1805 (-) Transcript_18225:1615-7029(-)
MPSAHSLALENAELKQRLSALESKVASGVDSRQVSDTDVSGLCAMINAVDDKVSKIGAFPYSGRGVHPTTGKFSEQKQNYPAAGFSNQSTPGGVYNCTYCGGRGHLEDFCFHKHGFPPRTNNRQQRKVQFNNPKSRRPDFRDERRFDNRLRQNDRRFEQRDNRRWNNSGKPRAPAGFLNAFSAVNDCPVGPCIYCGSLEHDNWTCPSVIAEPEHCRFCSSSEHSSLDCRSSARDMVKKLRSSSTSPSPERDHSRGQVPTDDSGDIEHELAVVEAQMEVETDTELLYDLKQRRDALKLYLDNQPSAFKRGLLTSIPCMCCDSDEHNMLSCPVIKADKEWEDVHPEHIYTRSSAMDTSEDYLDGFFPDLAATDSATCGTDYNDDEFTSMLAVGFCGPDGEPVSVMIDTGASYPVLRSTFVKKYGLVMRPNNGRLKPVQTGSKHIMTPLGTVLLTLTFDGHPFTILFRVFNTLSHGIILGNRELFRRGMNLSLPTLSVTMFDDKYAPTQIPVSIGEVHEDSKFSFKDLVVCMPEEVVCPGHSKIMVPAVVKRSVNDGAIFVEFSPLKSSVNVLIEGSPKLRDDYGILASRSMDVLTKEGVLSVMLINPNNAPIELNKHRIIGSVSVLSDTVETYSALPGCTVLGDVDFDPDNQSPSGDFLDPGCDATNVDGVDRSNILAAIDGTTVGSASELHSRMSDGYSYRSIDERDGFSFSQPNYDFDISGRGQAFSSEADGAVELGANSEFSRRSAGLRGDAALSRGRRFDNFSFSRSSSAKFSSNRRRGAPRKALTKRSGVQLATSSHANNRRRSNRPAVQSIPSRSRLQPVFSPHPSTGGDVSALTVDDEGWLKRTPEEVVVSDDELMRQIAAQIHDDMDAVQRNRIVEMVMKYKPLLTAKPNRPTRTPIIKHHVENDGISYVKPYRLSHTEYDMADTLVQEMLDNDIIRPSSSPYNAPIVLAAKKDGSVRFCIDFRGLNKVTKVSKYPLSNPQSCFDALGGAFYFTSLDLMAAYWSVELDEEDKEKTAFTVRSGKFEFNVMPFGLTNAVATFCALADHIFAGLQWSFCLCFIDDCLVFSPNDFDLHLKHVEQVLVRLQSANLKLKLRKCHFCGPEAPFLGHIVSRNGLRMDPKKIEAVQRIARPVTKKDVRSFLGMAGYYRSFIKDFSIIAAPLHKLTQKSAAREVLWNEDCEVAFNKLKHALTTYPVLQFPDFSEDFILETDASKTGLGAVLMQKRGDGKVVIGYASRLCIAAERNYNITELECLAVVFAVDHFRPYLYGRPFTVITDHSALKWLMRFKNPVGRLARWALTLQQYNFVIGFRPGTLNPVADALSRLRTLPSSSHSTPAPTPSLAALTPLDYDIEQLGSEFASLLVMDQPFANDVALAELRVQQHRDLEISRWIDYMDGGQLTGDNKIDAVTVSLCRYMGYDGEILYHFWEQVGDKRRKVVRKQAVIPLALRDEVLKWAHTAWFAGHQGAFKSFQCLREHYWWPSMYHDMEEFVKKCLLCQRLKNPAPGSRINPPLRARPQPQRPWEVVSMDAMTIGSVEVMIFVDTFTRYPEATVFHEPINGRNLSNAFVREVVARHGCPSLIICDNVSYQVGGQFKETCHTMGIQMRPVTTYHPQANGIAESKVKALKNLLRSLSHINPDGWEAILPLALFAYRSAFHKALGDKPFYLEHGRDPVMPGNLSLGLQNRRSRYDNRDLRMFTVELQQRMEHAFDLTARNLQITQDSYMQRDVPDYFNVGDQVLVFHPSVGKNESKTFKQWWRGPYVITERISPVLFRVQNLVDANDVQSVYAARLKKRRM